MLIYLHNYILSLSRRSNNNYIYRFEFRGYQLKQSDKLYVSNVCFAPEDGLIIDLDICDSLLDYFYIILSIVVLKGSSNKRRYNANII